MSEIVFTGLPAYFGYTVRVVINGNAGTAQVGHIAIGRVRELGTTMEGTIVGYRDFSTKERDPVFGTVAIVERESARFAEYQFAVISTDEYRVTEIVKRVRATPTVWYAGDDTDQFGTTIFGFLADEFRIPLASRGVSIATLKVESLT